MGQLTLEQLKFYDDNGYLVLDVMTEEEIEEISKEYDAVFKRNENEFLEATWKGTTWTRPETQNHVSSIHGLQMHSAAFTKLMLNERFLDACEGIMRTSDIVLHHTKAHTKPPSSGAPFPMHQDYPYFPYKNDSMVGAFFSFEDSKKENGGLCVYPGSHKLGPLEDVSDDPAYHYLDEKKYPLDKATPVTMKRGQLMLFSYLLIHGSYPNVSDRVRRLLLIQLYDAHDQPTMAIHQGSSCQGLVLRGSNPHRDANYRNVLESVKSLHD